jgi:arylformamidase
VAGAAQLSAAVAQASPQPSFYAREYNNRELVPDHAKFMARWQQASLEARAKLGGYLDRRYGGAPGETIDLFPARNGDGTCLLFIHGGYWRSLDKSDHSFIAPAWVEAGVSVAVVNYDLCPKVTVEAIVRQMLRAARWLWLNAGDYGIDENRLFVSGHSAGGHLTAMMMAALWPIFDRRLPAGLFKGGLAVSGIYDVRPIVEVPWLNVDLKLDEAAARKLSPALLPPATRAPVMTCVGAEESSEFRRQNALLGKRWKDVLAGDIVVPGAHHFSVIDGLGDPSSALFAGARRLMGLAQ